MTAWVPISNYRRLHECMLQTAAAKEPSLSYELERTGRASENRAPRNDGKFAHWLASDLSRPGPAQEFEPRLVPRGRGRFSEPGPRNAAEPDGLMEAPTGDIRVQTPGRNVLVADSEGTRENKLLTDEAVNMSFVGIWAADARACSALDR